MASQDYKIVRAMDLLQGPAAADLTAQTITEAIQVCLGDFDDHSDVRREIISKFLERWQEATRTAEAERLKTAIYQHFSPAPR
jgi:hypothetical protein